MPRTLALGFALAVATTAAAQQPNATFVPWANKLLQPTDPPAILTHDFGTVPKGTILVHKFTVTNIYDVPLQVIDIRKSCSCLDAVPPTQLLQPHDTAELVLTMNADKFTGPNAQSFFVTFGPQFVSTAVIQLKANSRADVTVTPGQLNFGVVPAGSTPTQSASIKYAGRLSGWKVTGVVPPTGPFTAVLADGGDEYALRVTMKPDAPPGPVTDTVTLRTNDPTAPVLTVSLSAVVQSALTASPGRVRFETKLGESQSQRVVIRATKPFRLQKAEEFEDGLTVETFPAAGPVQVVTVTFTPKAVGTVLRDIIFPTDLGPAKVSVEAIGTK